jgi:ABC-type transport system substrate-binding protein
MRTKWLLIALPLVIFGVLAQSAFWVPTYASQANGNPERLKTFLRAGIGDAKLLNPMVSSDAGASEIMDGNIFEGLVDADENLKLIGRLADRWDITEDAYLAVLPDRTLPDGSPATAAHLLSVIDAAWKSSKLGAVQASIQSLEIVPGETRTLSESALQTNSKGKQESVSVDMTVAVPERIKLRLSKVETQLFKQLEAVLGRTYFQNYPFTDRFKLKKPELASAIRDHFPELLGIGEHNPIITFYLHPGVRWHDGAPFTADDVKFTYDAIIDPKNASPRASSFDPVKSVEVVDELTARVTYKRLYAPAIIDWTMGIIPKHLLDDDALKREMDRRALSAEARSTFSIRSSDFNRHPIGTGPFRFTEWRPDQFIHLTRDDSYWGPKPEYDQLYFRVLPDYLTMELEFHAGALDWYDALPHQAARYRNDPEYQVLPRNRGYFSYIGYNERRPLFQDARVRRALGMALDVNSIIKYALSGEGKRSKGPYVSNTPYSDPDLKPLPYDPAGALALLADVGWKKNAQGMLEKDGKPFEFTLVTNNGNPQRKAIMTIAQAAWRKLGIDCKIQAFEWTVFLEDFVHSLNFDAVVLAWVGGGMSPDKYEVWHSSQTHPYELNYTGYKSAHADDLIMRIREEYDFDTQVRLARELDRTIAEDQPYTFLYETLEPVVLDKRIVRVIRQPDGSETIKKIQASPSGAIDTFFYEWRKLYTVPEYVSE